MQLASESSKQIMQEEPATQGFGAPRSESGGRKALRVPLCCGANTTCASQPPGQARPSSYKVARIDSACAKAEIDQTRPKPAATTPPKRLITSLPNPSHVPTRNLGRAWERCNYGRKIPTVP